MQYFAISYIKVNIMNIKKQIKIFIIDDNKVFSYALKAEIETAFIKRHITIFTFETGELCMKKFKEEKPQIVILDYYLNNKYPNAMDGVKVLDFIKKENSETDVIMLTINDHIDIALKSFHHGASDYIVKTETKFRKINYSLLNLFQIMEVKSNAIMYKRIVFAIIFCMALVLGAGAALLFMRFN